jgi:hypothetical protein
MFRIYFLFWPLLCVVGTLLICLSISSEFVLQMPQGFPLKAALLLTPIGIGINAMPFEGRSFLKYLWSPAIREGANMWNSTQILFTVLTLACFALLCMKIVKEKSKNGGLK